MLWTADLAHPVTDIVFVAGKDDEDAASVHITDGAWPTVQRVVVVFPAGIAQLPLVEAIVRANAYEAACGVQPFDPRALARAIGPLDGSVREVTQAAVDLYLGLRRLDGAAVRHASAFLAAAGTRPAVLPGATSKMLGKLTQFTDELGQEALHEWLLPALFIHTRPKPEHKNWWKRKPSISSTFLKAAQRYKALVNGQVPERLNAIPQWLLDLQQEADKLYLSASLSRTEADVFRTASAFMTASADLHRAESRYVLALVCLHRSCEWLLAAFCADERLLDFTFMDGLRLTSNRSKPAGFDMFLSELGGTYPRLTGLMAPLANLNQWRNLLTYTHHMSAPGATEAEDVFMAIRPKLPALAGKDWRDTLAVLGRPFPLSLVDLLDPLGDVRSSFVVKTAEELRLATGDAPATGS